MPTVTGDGDIYKELTRLLKSYFEYEAILLRMPEEERMSSKYYSLITSVSHRLEEITLTGGDLVDSLYIRKLFKGQK